MPVPKAAAIPVAGVTVATLGEEEDQVTEVSSCVLPSSNAPTAINGYEVPTASVLGFGVTEMEIRLAGTTVRVVVSLKPPMAAVSVVCPAPVVCARPDASIDAVDVMDEVQVTPLARSCTLPSL